ncbi:methionine adenosyltransferase 2 subunit beta [Nannochloropsis gaditana]|nr:methionine adenosyltransferase 2 subunit beta [Nannochloropsis gaditana]
MSSPAACARNPEKAMRVNCPLALLDALALHSPEALLVFFSTDQVFSGTVSPPALYSEAGESGRREEEEPVNVYGRSKRAFERAIQVRPDRTFTRHSSSPRVYVAAALSLSISSSPPPVDLAVPQDRWPRHLILRSSNIIGPPSPFLRQGKFLQWLDELLETSVGPLELFDDECRSFLYLQDVLSLLCALLDSYRPSRPLEGPTAGGNVGRGEPILGAREGEDAKDASSLQRASLPASARLLVGTYNMGGPDALTRVDLGRLVWRARGGERGDCSGRIVPVRRASLNLNFEAPLNIGMDSGKLRQDAGRLAFPGTSMEIAIPEILSQK